jgi:hypothetical protein
MAAVTFVRSGLMMPGKFPQGQRYVENRIKWLKEKFGVEASLMVLLGGQVGRIAMVAEQDSVAQIEKIRRESSVARFPKLGHSCACATEDTFGRGENSLCTHLHRVF